MEVIMSKLDNKKAVQTEDQKAWSRILSKHQNYGESDFDSLSYKANQEIKSYFEAIELLNFRNKTYIQTRLDTLALDTYKKPYKDVSLQEQTSQMDDLTSQLSNIEIIQADYRATIDTICSLPEVDTSKINMKPDLSWIYRVKSESKNDNRKTPSIVSMQG